MAWRQASHRLHRACNAARGAPFASKPHQQRRHLFGSARSSTTFQPELVNVDPSFSPDLMPSVLTALLKLHDEDDAGEATTASGPAWKVYQSPDSKGYGVKAARSMQRGTRLIQERPLCVWPNGLNTQTARALFDSMSPTSQQVFMKLSTGHAPADMDDVLARRATNGFAVQMEGTPTLGMVFANISRINHSCLPNASQSFNPYTFRMEVYALQDIDADKEICIEYLPTLITQTKSERIAALKSTFMMQECLCSLCSSSPENIAKSDERRLKLKSYSRELANGNLDRTAALARMKQMKELLEQEGYLGPPEFESESVSRAFAVYLTLR